MLAVMRKAEGYASAWARLVSDLSAPFALTYVPMVPHESRVLGDIGRTVAALNRTRTTLQKQRLERALRDARGS